MARTTKQVGDAWGRLFGLAVDACQSHHAAHCNCDDAPAASGKKETGAKGDGHGGHHRRHVRDPQDQSEIHAITLTAEQRCNDSWTGKRGEVIVNYEPTGVTVFDAPAMRLVPATGPQAAQSHAGGMNPGQVAPPGVKDVVVSLNPSLGRGMFIGRLCPNNGGTPNNPVLIYIDDAY